MKVKKKTSSDKIKQMIKNNQYRKFFEENGFKVDKDTEKGWEIIKNYHDLEKEEEGVESLEEKRLLKEYMQISKSRWKK